MARGERLAVLVDDSRAVRDIPGAAEMEGCAVIEVTAAGDGVTRIVIER